MIEKQKFDFKLILNQMFVFLIIISKYLIIKFLNISFDINIMLTQNNKSIILNQYILHL